ncbi:MAG: hypothetical protein KJN80_03425 [Deltaproteobacteria bacterium]|nr:hypothetical protein [Deltaproteobacteria bacterium]
MSYYESDYIGSSLLAKFIDHQDKAALETKPTESMEDGKRFEDLVQQEITGESIFDDKYFRSDLKSIPSTTKEGAKPILEIMESENFREEVDNGYILKADGTPHGTYKNHNRCLDQIKAHDYRRPIPETSWGKFFKMLENIKRTKFELMCKEFELSDLLQNVTVTQFQREHFWEDKSGAKCRMKTDMQSFYQVDEEMRGLIWDIKVTANWNTFLFNWRTKYIWQNKHYLSGFQNFCELKKVRPPEKMWYIIVESTPPYLVTLWALHPIELEELDSPYHAALKKCQTWIDAGKPTTGFRKQQTVNRYGREM